MGNLLTAPQDFSNAAWTKTNLTVTVNADTDPVGNVTADRLFETTANAEHPVTQSVTSTIGLHYLQTVCLKQGGGSGRSAAGLYFNNGSGVVFGLQINLATGAFALVGAGNFPNANVVVQYMGGYYRVFVWADAISTTMQFYLEPIATYGGSPSYAGNAAAYITAWDAWMLQATQAFEMPNPLPVNAKSFDLVKNQLVSPAGSGFIQTIDRGPNMWVAHYETPPLTPARDIEFQAFIDSLDGAGQTFLGFDPRKTKPNAYASALYASEPWAVSALQPPIVTYIDQPGSFINLSLGAVGATITKGDYISFRDANRWHLYRATNTVVSDGSGVWSHVGVTPRPPYTNVVMAYPAARLTRACSEMKVIGAVSKNDRVSDVGPIYSFAAVQYVNRA